MRRTEQPKRVIVKFGGFDYDMNLAICRLALVRRQVEGELRTMEGLAEAIERSRSTASRFFAGRQMSLPVALAVLDRLKLTFDEVYTPCSPALSSPTKSSRRAGRGRGTERQTRGAYPETVGSTPEASYGPLG